MRSFLTNNGMFRCRTTRLPKNATAAFACAITLLLSNATSACLGDEPGGLAPQSNLNSIQPQSSQNIQAHSIPGAIVIHKGSRFPVALLQALDSNKLKTGDKLKALLAEPLEVEGTTIARAGACVNGWVTSSYHKRSSMQARLSARNWLNSSAAVSTYFNEIVDDAQRIEITAQPAPDTVVHGANPLVPQKVDKNGKIIVEFHGAKYIAAGAGISALAFALGPTGLIVGPAVSGVLGATIPEYALDRPVTQESASTTTRGAVTGAVKGLPGGVLVSGLVNRGLAVSVPAGETIMLELTSDLVLNVPMSPKASSASESANAAQPKL